MPRTVSILVGGQTVELETHDYNEKFVHGELSYLGKIEILGVSFHVEARPPDVTDWHVAVETLLDDAEPQTVEIDGKPYVLAIYPYPE